MENRSGPSGEGRTRRSSGQVLGVTDGYSSPSSDHDVITVDPENKCKHGLPFYVRYNWTFDNLGRRYACCCENKGMKCASFRWVDPEWDARTKGVLVKLMKRKEKAEEEARSWEEAWRIAKEANDTTYELHLMKRYFGEATNSLMNTRQKMRNDALLKKMEKPLQ
ncbi:hypothetical protein SETIT_2G091200v2 [Setaria italica]|uniref:Zinc finger GRF-type domain-containing protein n=1 Tax=Setaria italica TaxID=4555 RepID=A0A368PWJ7_SETIT|nr:hypothetical protein SETIT_2G091200v2 [Setaria italica]